MLRKEIPSSVWTPPCSLSLSLSLWHLPLPLLVVAARAHKDQCDWPIDLSLERDGTYGDREASAAGVGGNAGRAGNAIIQVSWNIRPRSPYLLWRGGGLRTNSIQFNSIQSNSIQSNPIQSNPIQFNSIQFKSVQFNPVRLNSIEFNSS